MKNLTISSHYAKAIMSGAKKKGYDVSHFLKKSGIDEQLLEQPKARISTDKFIKLFKLTWKEMDDEFSGRTSSPCRLGHFHLMGSLVAHCVNLEEVIQQSIRCYKLFAEDLEIVLHLEGEEAELSLTHLTPEHDPDHFLIEWLLVVWHRFIGWLIGKKIVLSRADFQFKMPLHVDEYRFAFPCMSRFEQPRNSIFFSKNYLSIPVTRSTTELDQFMRSSPKGLLIWAEEDNSLTTQIRSLLEPHHSGGLPGIECIANKLGISSYTLSRKLKAEGSSYQKIKDNFRRDQAIIMLTRQNITISDISDTLGFTEPGAFSRAFKHWTGVSPLAYRKDKNIEG